MAYDGIVTKAIVDQLKDTILDGKINKIYQPEEYKLTFDIYSKGMNSKLLISADSSSSRVHLIDNNFKNPDTPPTFCMVLRKHLDGGKIFNIEQYKMDRIIFIDIVTLNELAIPVEKRLVVEIMGRHSNIILIKKDTSKIIDSIKKIDISLSRERQILPGLKYCTPPTGDKSDPLNIDESDFLNLFERNNPNIKINQFFHNNFLGFSPLIGSEISYRVNLEGNHPISTLSDDEKNKLLKEFNAIITLIKNKNYHPTLFENKTGGFKDFHVLDISMYSNLNQIIIDNPSKMLETYYNRNHKYDSIRQKSQSLRKLVQSKLETSHDKLKKQYREFKESEDREKYKIYADLISANSHSIARGLKEVKLNNFYCPEMSEITIPLDIKLNPHENAQKYYKKYSKLKNANNLLKKQIPLTKLEIEYLDNILTSIDNSSELDNLEEIKDELIDSGYIKKTKKKKKKSSSKPYHFISSEGYNIYVGKNNRQNDELTLKFANKNDIWLHVQNMPGSHVIIRNDRNFISEKVIEEAAILAGYFSKGRQSNNLPIDYTFKKNVSKPKGAKLGMVIYEEFNTIFVTPKIETLDKLEKLE